jgi:hypothetical protein
MASKAERASKVEKTSKAESAQVFLESDDEIRGQKFICLSFLSPEKVLAKKEIFFFNKFPET